MRRCHFLGVDEGSSTITPLRLLHNFVDLACFYLQVLVTIGQSAYLITVLTRASTLEAGPNRVDLMGLRKAHGDLVRLLEGLFHLESGPFKGPKSPTFSSLL